VRPSFDLAVHPFSFLLLLQLLGPAKLVLLFRPLLVVSQFPPNHQFFLFFGQAATRFGLGRQPLPQPVSI
jgi:hypothetical protein